MKPERKIVSIVTPTYNRLKELKRCVESVVKQTYSYIEHIIVGDSCPILNSIVNELLEINPNLIIINLPQCDDSIRGYRPSKIARVRNYGIKICSGYYISHLDDDNTIDPNHIGSLVELLENDSTLLGVHSYRKLWFPDGTPYTLEFHPWSDNIETAKKVYQTYLRMGIYNKDTNLMADRITFNEERPCTIDCSELLVKRKLHERFPFKTSYTDEEISNGICEDDSFCMELYEKGIEIKPNGLYSLNFFLGGKFTEKITPWLLQSQKK